MAAEPLAPSDTERAQARQQPWPWDLAFTVFLIATVVFAVSPVITNYDSFATFPTAVSLVNRDTLSLDAYAHLRVLATSYTVSHTHGHLLTSYPWAVGLFAAPAVVVIDLVHALGGPSADAVMTHHARTVQIVQLLSASVVTGLACAAMAVLAYRRLQVPVPHRRRWALLCGLVFAFATSAWSTASRALWQHGPSILFLAVALLALDRIFPRDTGDDGARDDSAWAPLIAGVALAAAVTMRPTNAVAFGLGTILVLWRTPSPSRIRFVVGALVVFVPWALVTDHYYGSLLQPYDRATKLGLPSTFFESVAAQLISPSRGLLVFSPIVLVAVAGFVIARKRRTLTPLDVLSAVAVPCYLAVIALFPVWWAGTSFGPRFMTETLPFLLVLSVPFVEWLAAWHAEKPEHRPLAYRVAVAGSIVVLAFSVFVNAQGGLLSSTICWNLRAPGMASVDRDPARAWSWSNPQVVYGVRAVGTEGLAAAVTRCPTGTPLP